MLTGLRIVVTRSTHQAEELAAPLRALGAEVIALPAIAILPPRDTEALQRAAAEANRYDWIIFTSANGVEHFCSVLPDGGASIRANIAAVGSATREAAVARGLAVAVMPERYVAESLLDALSAYKLAGKRVLLPRAAVARDVIPEELRSRGAYVNVVDAYRNGLPPEIEAAARSVFRPPFPHWVLFASTSAVDNIVGSVGADCLRHSRIASIGPVTSQAIRYAGLIVDAEAKPHTIKGLVAAVASFHMGS